MEIDVQIVNGPLPVPAPLPPHLAELTGAAAEFSGIVRSMENGARIAALEYEVYHPMAELVIRKILAELGAESTCLRAEVFHREGLVPVGEKAIYVRVAAKHRTEAFTLLQEFMNRLKKDVPIWKVDSRQAHTESAPRP